ncbi:hypothetical protein HK101_003641 [Irineochytrium annulatum]|nr:hypothetical protein HK101_003641 [Irineochytrium annulatum]
MEQQTGKIVDAHTKAILCVQFNPYKREIYTGGEDHFIRVWEGDSGKLLNTLSDHIGWVTTMLYCKELKVLFSASIDGMILVWGVSCKLVQKIETKFPIYCLAYNSRRQQLLVGHDKRVRVFQTISTDDSSHVGSTSLPSGGGGSSNPASGGGVNPTSSGGGGGPGTTDVLERRSVSCEEHTDVVSCMVSAEGRFYSAGYDRKIVIYDIPHHGDLRLKVSHVVQNAHDAAISCMVYGKDADNSWLITGSFDRTVKLWSLDGNLLQRFDGFGDTITSVCYVLPTQTLWITASSTSPVVYDPRSGINVTDFVGASDGERVTHNAHSGAVFYKQLLFVPEVNEVIGATNRRSLTIWKYNPIASVTVLSGHTDVVECLAFTLKEPLLIFSGGTDGIIRKWERLQLNTFMYRAIVSQEPLILPKEEKQEDEPIVHSLSRNPEERRKKQAALHRRVSENLDAWRRGGASHQEEGDPLRGGENQVELMSAEALRAFRRRQSRIRTQGKDKKEVSRDAIGSGGGAGAKGFGGLGGDAVGEWRRSVEKGEACQWNGPSGGAHGKGYAKPGVLSLCYYEELDLLVSGHEDSKIHVWGYNEEAVKFVPVEAGEREKDAAGDPGGIGDSVTNRVAGMTLKYSLTDHREAVTGVACFFKDERHWMEIQLSTGWDRRICIYDLKLGRLHDVFRNNGPSYHLAPPSLLPSSTSTSTAASAGREELAADGIILALEYNQDRCEFGVASADKVAYIRRFSPRGDEMALMAALIGHEAEVTQIKWNGVYQQWVTGSEDRTIRIWAAEGLPLIKVINNDGPVTALCVDVVNGCLMTGSQDKCIRVFDPDKKDEVVQKNSGHTDEVRAIIHIPYVSASWDKTVRIWNAYLKKGQRRVTTKTASAYYGSPNQANMFDEPEETGPTYSELNPLIMPKLLTKPVYIKEIITEKPQANEDFTTAMEQTRLEDELRSTLNDLEYALSGEKMHPKKPRAKVAPAAKGRQW